MRSTLFAAALLVAAPAAAKPDPDLLAQIAALRAEVAALRARLDAREPQSASATAPAPTAAIAPAHAIDAERPTPTGLAAAQPAASPAAPPAIRLRFGGFLAAETISRGRTMGADIATPFAAIPFGNAPLAHVPETRFTARQSRISILAQSDPSPGLRLTGYYEMDFLGAARTANPNESNSFNPRIREAYLTADWSRGAGRGFSVLAGQNWSLATLNSRGIAPRTEAPPPVIDAQFVPGFVWTRQPQLRFTAAGPNAAVALSLEAPQTTIYAGPNPLPAGVSSVTTTPGGANFDPSVNLSLNRAPDVIVKAAFDAAPGGHAVHAEGFAIAREQFARVNQANSGDWHVSVGGSLTGQIAPGLLSAELSGAWGRGLGRYGTSQLPDATLGPDGRLRPVTSSALLAGLILTPTRALDLYAFAGRELAEASAFTAGGVAYGYGNPLYGNAGCFTEGGSPCVGNTRLVRQLTGGLWFRPYQGPAGRVQLGVQYSRTERAAFAGVGGAPTATNDMVLTSIRFAPF